MKIMKRLGLAAVPFHLPI